MNTRLHEALEATGSAEEAAIQIGQDLQTTQRKLAQATDARDEAIGLLAVAREQLTVIRAERHRLEASEEYARRAVVEAREELAAFEAAAMEEVAASEEQRLEALEALRRKTQAADGEREAARAAAREARGEIEDLRRRLAERQIEARKEAAVSTPSVDQ